MILLRPTRFRVLLTLLLVTFGVTAVWAQGVLPEAFSVSDYRQVRFSKGNLQYKASSNQWRFALHQWDYVGDANANISSSYNGWIDLFGWATSGYNHGAIDYQPWSQSWSWENNLGWHNRAYGECGYNLYDQTGQADWGYNAISNGGNTTNTWRTLTADEWWYLLFTRNTESGIRYAKATVNDVSGLVLLPDNWDPTYYALNHTNDPGSGFVNNIISTTQWRVLEQYGAVFLPAAGFRYGTELNNVGEKGSYWSASYLDCDDALGMGFEDGGVTPQRYHENNEGLSVRLVRNVSQEFSVTMRLGWNWFSSPVEYDQNSFESLKESLASTCSTVTIKSQTEYIMYHEGMWYGQLSQLDQGKMYMISLDQNASFTLSGMWADPTRYAITIAPGWNWIGYPSNATMTVNKALSHFSPADGDIIKSQSGFSFYNAVTHSWQGSLTILEPGVGYMYYSYRSGNTVLQFPSWSDDLYYHSENVPAGGVNGLFSLGENRQVYFSQGNLQYIGSASNPYWKFADHQWDFLGDNGQGSSASNVNRDLFGWGTSGYNHGAACYQPWSISENASDYYAYGSLTNDLFDQTGKADWGYNAISNGGNVTNRWRTPTSEEWKYVFDTRITESGYRFAKGKVNNVNGVILLPDDWRPGYYPLFAINQVRATYDVNVIGASEWSALEQHGAVFLPAAGERYGSSLTFGTGYYAAGFGSYWASDHMNSNEAMDLYFYEYNVFPLYGVDRSDGLSVRLVGLPEGELPQVATSYVTDITATTAICGGHVLYDGGMPLLDRGVCWSLSHDPTLDDYHGSCGTGEGAFSLEVSVYPNTTYYVRAYATNLLGTSYGDEVSFTTGQGTSGTPEGVIDGIFSVGEGSQVYFSRGNLQYIGSAATPYWKFAENQWDYLGDNGQGSGSETADRDLFAWGTSGYDHGAYCYQPWSTSMAYNYYNVYGGYGYNLYDQTGQADWGYNPISNGGNTENTWHTPTLEEWDYVFNTRNTVSGVRYAKAKVNGVNGVILLPDAWETSIYTLSNVNQGGVQFTSNVINASDWYGLEQHGAVFLPAAGGRYGTSVGGMEEEGCYWSSSCSGSTGAYQVWFYQWSLDPTDGHGRSFCKSVRLIRSIHNSPSQGYAPWELLNEQVQEVTSSTASYSAFPMGGTHPIISQGACWSTSPNPTLADNVAEGDINANGYVCGTLNGLSPNTTYYLRVFVTDSEQTRYSENVIFTTFGVHTYVDLGLPSGNLWATCNVGSDTPEGYGYYYSWGETEPKGSYSMNNYKYHHGTYNTLTRYCPDGWYGYNNYSDTLTILLPEDDAATVNWGSDWHTPTRTEWQELLDHTTQVWTTQNGVNGMCYTAPNGNSIFLPASGYREDGYLYYLNQSSQYWSSSLYIDYPCYATYLIIKSGSNYFYQYMRSGGRPVRPVRSNIVK